MRTTLLDLIRELALDPSMVQFLTTGADLDSNELLNGLLWIVMGKIMWSLAKTLALLFTDEFDANTPA